MYPASIILFDLRCTVYPERSEGHSSAFFSLLAFLDCFGLSFLSLNHFFSAGLAMTKTLRSKETTSNHGDSSLRSLLIVMIKKF